MSSEALRIVEPGAPSSLMEQLRLKRAEAAARTTVDLPVPGYVGELLARYRLLDPLVEGRQIGDRVVKQFEHEEERQFYAFADTLIAACVGLFLRGPDGELEPLLGSSGEPVGYDAELAKGLGLEAQTAREVLLAVFADNKVAVTEQAVRLNRWMADPSKGALLGEA